MNLAVFSLRWTYTWTILAISSHHDTAIHAHAIIVYFTVNLEVASCLYSHINPNVYIVLPNSLLMIVPPHTLHTRLQN